MYLSWFSQAHWFRLGSLKLTACVPSTPSPWSWPTSVWRSPCGSRCSPSAALQLTSPQRFLQKQDMASRYRSINLISPSISIHSSIFLSICLIVYAYLFTSTYVSPKVTTRINVLNQMSNNHYMHLIKLTFVLSMITLV